MADFSRGCKYTKLLQADADQGERRRSVRAKRDKPGDGWILERTESYFIFIQIITMPWTMTASDRKVHEHLARELLGPKREAPSLEEGH